MMNYPKQNAYLRARYIDGVTPHVDDYVWVYNSNMGHTPRKFTGAHRSILHVRKTKNNTFYKAQVAQPYKNPNVSKVKRLIDAGSPGRMPYSWFEYNLVKNISKEKTIHACQIPQKLTEMLVNSSTKEGDTVLVLFGGSGSELEVCKKMKRNYISAEIVEKYHSLLSDRLENGKISKEYKLGPRGGKVKKQL